MTGIQAPRGRPWSLPEIDMLIPQVQEQLDEALTNLLDLGDRKAALEWSFKRHEAIALVHAREHFKGEKSAAEDRSAWSLLYEFVETDFPSGLPDVHWLGCTLIEAGQAADMAANAYDTQRKALTALQAQLDTLRTLHVSGREHGPDRR